jgi:hypothetical protein
MSLLLALMLGFKLVLGLGLGLLAVAEKHLLFN